MAWTRKPFDRLKVEARDWFRHDPLDRWRVMPSLDGIAGYDNLEKFFNRPASQVSNSDIIRWRAVVEVVREKMGG